MKEFIEYYYGMKDILLYRNNDKYRFKYENSDYYFVPLTRNVIEINEIDSYIGFNENFDQIVKNIYNQLITKVDNMDYVLIKKSYIEENILDFIMRRNKNVNLVNFYNKIDHSNWCELWSKKIDNIEYQMSHLDGKYPILNEVINYYIGMAECAISYVNILVNSNSDDLLLNNKVISHLRIFERDFNSPQNIIIDYKSRDISEYLKFIFFKGDYDYSIIEKILLDLNYDGFSLALIYGRLFFPTFFFDKYDQIINSVVKEKEILNIINRSNEYEKFVNNIYLIMSQQKKIPKISWD